METPTIEEREYKGTTKPVSRDNPPTRRKSRAWIWLIILAALAYGGWHYRGVFASGSTQTNSTGGSGRGGGGAIPVVVATATRGDIPVFLRGPGTVSAFNTVTVHSRVDGQLLNVLFTEGQVVRQGDVLAELDPRPFQVQLEQAEGQLARDTASLNNAMVDLERYKNLFKEGVISEQQAATQQSLVNQLQGAIKADQGPIDTAKLNLVYCKITAPITGRIGLRLVDVGNMIHANDPTGLVVITQLQPISAFFSLPQNDLPDVYRKLRAGARLPVDAYDREGGSKIASGTLTTIDNQIDQATGTFKLKVVFNNEDNALFPNQFVYLQLLLGSQQGLTIIPATAVLRGANGNYVYAVTKTSTVTVRPVTIAISEGAQVGLSSGLDPGESVVTDGQDKLQEGTKIEVHRAPTPQSTPSTPSNQGKGNQTTPTAPPAHGNRQ
jgi:multidrug efflux system membrane fusion protein